MATPAATLAPTPSSHSSARTERMLRGPVLATLLALAAPNIVVMLAQAAANFLESYYVGLLGVDALAGAALVFPLIMLMQMMSAGGIGGGISSAVARAIGSGNQARAEALACHAVIVALVFGLMFTVMLLAAGHAIYGAMGGSGAALDNAVVYSNAVFAGACFLWLLNALASILRGSGNMLAPAAVLTGGVLILLVSSPILIFGAGPMPPLGIAGAGLALVLYYVIGCAILLVKLARGHGGVRLSFKHPLQWALFADILGVGVPAIVNNVTSNLSVILATALVATHGAAGLAGFGLGIRLEYLQVPIVFGFGAGMVAMIGMNIGAGQAERARRIAWTGAAVAAGVTEIVGLAAAIFPAAWLGLFTHDAQAIAAGAEYLHSTAPAYGFFGAGLAFYFASQGARRMGWSIVGGLARVAVIAVGGAAVMRATGGSITALGWVLAAALVVFAAVNSVPWIKAHRH